VFYVLPYNYVRTWSIIYWVARVDTYSPYLSSKRWK